VASIDELLEKQVSEEEFYWAAIRKYLPAMGCTASEVISASRRSKFLEPPSGGADHSIFLRRENKGVIFRVHEDTGEIYGARVFSTQSWPIT